MGLQTYSDCVVNRGLFLPWDGNDEYDGQFVFELGNDGFSFHWLCGGGYHRVDGPAYVNRCGGVWWFLGNRVHVRSQDDFDEWLVRNFRI